MSGFYIYNILNYFLYFQCEQQAELADIDSILHGFVLWANFTLSWIDTPFSLSFMP